MTVEVYADADDVELLVNGESVGRPRWVTSRLSHQLDTTYRPVCSLR